MRRGRATSSDSSSSSERKSSSSSWTVVGEGIGAEDVEAEGEEDEATVIFVRRVDRSLRRFRSSFQAKRHCEFLRTKKEELS